MSRPNFLYSIKIQLESPEIKISECGIAQLNLLFLELHLCSRRYGDLLELIHLNDLNYQKYRKAEYVQRRV